MAELLQNAASGGVRERGEGGIEAGPGILNHVVQYGTRISGMQGEAGRAALRAAFTLDRPYFFAASPLPLIEQEGLAMLPKAKAACFVIPHISPSPPFVSGVELDHAQDIIADIMDTLVRALRPPFRLAKFEGDAAFVYALADKVDGSLMQDAIEQAYFAFRKRLRSIKQASSCECQACSRMQSLDVKFVVHHGEFIRQKMSGREELAGRDVILVHRLLKNEVGKTFGPHAYALYSDACVQAMRIDPAAQGLLEHAEAIEHIGETN